MPFPSRALTLLVACGLAMGACRHLPLDSDRDSVPDHVEDQNHNGRVDPGETDPRRADTDADGLDDGQERAGRTNPLRADTDSDGLRDGVEDRNHNGIVDEGETDPKNPDTDGDLIADGVEDANKNGRRDAWESSPLLADTDRDHVPDGEEDTNRNGRLDVGETSAVLPCTRWGEDGFCAPAVPEPMMVDLVRGLGARAGEVEANVLAVVRLGEGRVGLAWAPEVEVAIADGWAVELELPFEEQHLKSVKLAAQGTVGVTHEGRAAHGLQIIGEASMSDDAMSLTSLYVLSARISSRASMNVLAGASLGRRWDGHPTAGLLLSPSLYADLMPKLSVGIEAQVALSLSDSPSVTATPQLRWRLSPHLLLQAGVGARLSERGPLPFIATRFAVEL